MNFKNVFMLIYDGGRCGEFLTSFLHEHRGIKNNSHGFDPVTNRYFAFNTNNPHALDLWHSRGIKPRLVDFDMQDYQHDDDTKILFRSHQPLPFEDLFPGLGTITVHSKEYNEFFLLLYWIKYMNRPNSQGQLKWKAAFDVDTVEQLLAKDIFVANNMLVTPQRSRELYQRDFYFDLDKLFFDRDLTPYRELCDFMGINSLDRAKQVFEEYHDKNLRLVEEFGITVSKDRGDQQLRQNIIKTMPKLEPLQIISHSFTPKI